MGLSCAHDDPVAGLSAGARAALERAAVVVGSDRQRAAIAPLVPTGTEQLPIGGDLAGLDVAGDRPGPTVVLASGDPGFFGVLRAVRTRWPEPDAITVEPALSSVQAVCAAAGEPWDDAVVLSAHGRDPRPVLHACRRLAKAVVLTGPAFGPAELLGGLDARPRRAVVGERLGSTDARVHTARTPASPGPASPGPAWPAAWLDAGAWHEPNVVVLTDESPETGAGRTRSWATPERETPTAWALPEEAFDHRDGMITKAEVRALALAWLGPGLGDLVWDVGAGSGAVAVECARLGAAAVALDRDPGQVARARANAAAHGVPVDAREGAAPGALADLPDPDAVFVGGGGREIAEVVGACAARGPRVIVTAVAALERVAPAGEALTAAGYTVDGTQLQSARLAPLGEARRLSAQNPVVLVRGVVPSAGAQEVRPAGASEVRP
ncbi:precorrin-6y C5,15-methyltransferase (decarboxylating) subunit CbiE [Egibacter rhizosphaerae]|uniref:Precorrin-6y C5,15-methyltransferase (Decarboxylating) subunit CbiE n=1 Tax=Egibacter rhizosphaerae TaxID=1670831 RepID=A0A411YL93_9ACTN|nr:precorrin-6y C5,15-methyltransferase (decarboxylating) subunit CbiE [Egibacter rhizosphaerae]